MRSIILGAALASAVAVPAQAHWQFTKWQMTADQVVAASKGTVHRAEGSETETVAGESKEVVGSYTSNGRDMRANFWFKADGLAKVHLTTDNRDDCAALYRYLGSIYGSPASERTGQMRSTVVWLDKVKNNRVQVNRWSTGACDLYYAPLPTAASTGL